MVIQYLILCLALIWETTTDYITIKLKRKPDNHKADILPRGLFMVVSSVSLHFLYEVPFLPGFIYAFCLFTALFDPIMGMLLHKNPLYKSPDSKFDRLILATTPWYGEIFTRFWILGVGWGCYHCWDLVIGK